ncbi:MAG: NADH-quinone oxidoreductase subunit C [Desulfovibrio sp.]|nr:NADH-quinone oxidoreductase subunit C [Desulfovibrio sp.]
MNQQSTPHESLSTSLAALAGAQVRQTDYAAKGYDLDVSLPLEALVPAVSIMDAAEYFLDTITGVDWLGEQAALRKEAEAAEAKLRAEAQARQAEEAAARASGNETAGAATEPAPAPVAESSTKPAEDSGTKPAPAADTAAVIDTATQAPDAALLPEDEIEVVYDFNRFQSRHRVVLRVRTPRSQPQVPTILNIYPIAHWLEREAHDFFGIVFTGHAYLVPLLLPEDADFHPLLKDYGA